VCQEARGRDRTGLPRAGRGARKSCKEGATPILEEDVLVFISPEDYLFSRLVRNAERFVLGDMTGLWMGGLCGRDI
jgi:hypothetical protein